MKHPILILALLLPLRAHAQWHLVLVAGNGTSRGDSRDAVDTDHAEIRADPVATVAVAAGRELGAWRVVAELHHHSGDLAEVTPSAVVAARGVLSAWGGALAAQRRLAGRTATSLWGELAASADRWSFDVSSSPPRWRFAARAALEADVPIAGAWSGVARGTVVVGSSIFRAEEIPEGFARQTAIRAGYAVGFAWRWGGSPAAIRP